MPAATTNAASATTTKENDGRGRRRRCLTRTVILLSVSLVSYHLLWTYWLAGVFVPDTDKDPVTGALRVRRRPDLLFKRDKFTNQKVATNAFDGILEGYLTLIDIQLPSDNKGGLFQQVHETEDGSGSATKTSYSGVTATFCHIAWQLQQDDPSRVPMFRDLQSQSPLCPGTIVSRVDLHTVVQQARLYDAGQHNFTATKPKPGHVAVKPTAVIFHQTRCGSTLVSNVLSQSLPPQVRSYSEAPPPLTALLACDVLEARGHLCDAASHHQLIRDVFYLLGRVTRPQQPQYVFYKMQSVGVRAIAAFAQALPHVPWAFVYRDPVEIVMSHFRHLFLKDTTDKRNNNPQPPQKQRRPVSWRLSSGARPVCLRSYQQSQQHPLLLDVVNVAGRNASSLSPEEYCAAHLASLAQAAVAEYQKQADVDNNFQRRHWFFNYRHLPDALWDQWLPHLHMGYVPPLIPRMQQTASVYSKARGSTGNVEWSEDATAKQARAPPSVRDAAQLFMEPLYQQMQAIEALQK